MKIQGTTLCLWQSFSFKLLRKIPLIPFPGLFLSNTRSARFEELPFSEEIVCVGLLPKGLRFTGDYVLHFSQNLTLLHYLKKIELPRVFACVHVHINP